MHSTPELWCASSLAVNVHRGSHDAREEDGGRQEATDDAADVDGVERIEGDALQ